MTRIPEDLRRLVLALVAGSVPIWAVAARSADAEAPFLAENVAAMTRMMDGMAIKPSGEVDADFAAMMIPHHQGAIAMAEAELRYGHNDHLRRIAQEIVVEQQQEIVAMRLALSRPPAPSNAAPTGPAPAAPDRGAEATVQAAAPKSIGSINTNTETPQWKRAILALVLFAGTVLTALAGQAPYAASDPDIPISHRDRVYAAEQFSNTISVIDPADNSLLGVIRLGDPAPTNFSPLYRGQVLVHGMGFSPDRRTLAVVSIGSNSVTFIDTATNAVKHTSYVGRSPHEAFFTPDGREVWVTVRGEDYVAVLDAASFEEKTRIKTPSGPGMQIFSPDGRYAYVCSSFNPEVDVFTVADHQLVAKVQQASPFCPNIAATPDDSQVWFTLKDTGKTQVFDARPPFSLIKTLDTGPITNHVNFVVSPLGQFAYITVGGLNEVQVFRTDDFSKVTSIEVGNLPHGIWPSGDGSRVYVGLENDDEMLAIDTRTNRVIASVPIGQAPQAVNYVADAVPAPGVTGNAAMTTGGGMTSSVQENGTTGLQPLGVAGEAAHFVMVPTGTIGAVGGNAPTSVTLFDQGLIQILEASVTKLEPKQRYVLALADKADGSGVAQGLTEFMTNPSGSAIVNAIGPIRQVVRGEGELPRRYLVILPVSGAERGKPTQIQSSQ